MKKQCKGCYAAVTGQHQLQGEAHGCDLNYTDGSGHPRENCPKPTSWAKLKKLKEQIKNYVDITMDDLTCGL